MVWVWRMERRRPERIVRFESVACDSKSRRTFALASYACTHRIPARTCMQRPGTGIGWPTRFAVTISPWDSTPIPIARGIASACIPSIVQRARAAAEIFPTGGTLRRNAGGVLCVDQPCIAWRHPVQVVRSVLADQASLCRRKHGFEQVVGRAAWRHDAEQRRESSVQQQCGEAVRDGPATGEVAQLRH